MEAISEDLMEFFDSFGVNIPSYKKIKEKVGVHLNSMSNSLIRREYIKRFGFCIPCSEMIEVIRKHSGGKRILEVGAGSGFLSYLLNANGMDVIATDKYIEKNHYGFQRRFFEVEEIDAVDAINKYDVGSILMSWPCYNDRWAYDIAKRMRSEQILFYIGEGYGGCTADDKFHVFVDGRPHESEKVKSRCRFEYVEYVEIPTWFGIHDSLNIYRRK